MTDTSLQDAVEDEYETELSRIGSSKALYALTEGEMETEAVLSALATRAATAAEVFSEWTADGDHGELFATAAEVAREHADRIVGVAESSGEPAGEQDRVVDALPRQDDPDARLGGLLAWTLVTDRTLAQAVGFFVGNADPKAADLFRDLRSDVSDLREGTLERLDGDDVDGDAALEAANAVVEATYDQYVQTLEGMGVKVKPVC